MNIMKKTYLESSFLYIYVNLYTSSSDKPVVGPLAFTCVTTQSNIVIQALTALVLCIITL